MSTIEVNGQTLEIDEEGNLLDRMMDWTEDAAKVLAKEDGIELTKAHLEIIHFLRGYYDEYQIVPSLRNFRKAIAKQLGQDKGDSRYLADLFSDKDNPHNKDNPHKRAAKFAGLPMPVDL